MTKRLLFLVLLLFLYGCASENNSRITEGGYDMKRYIIADTPNLRDCEKFSEIPNSEIVKYINKHPKYKEVINNNQRACHALLVQSIDMLTSDKTQDIWYDNADYLLFQEKKPLLKEECNVLSKPMMHYVYENFKKEQLHIMEGKLVQCIKIMEENIMKSRLKFLLGQIKKAQLLK